VPTEGAAVSGLAVIRFGHINKFVRCVLSYQDTSTNTSFGTLSQETNNTPKSSASFTSELSVIVTY
jgi:hypothetical protein